MPYELLDLVERLTIVRRLSVAAVLQEVERSYPDVARPQLKVWVERFYRLFARNQWKRERYAPSFHVDDANLDPKDGSGLHQAIRDLLSDQRLSDVSPRGHFGTDTVDWTDPVPGDLRVSYVLPSVHWRIVDSGVLWPAPDDPFSDTVATASRHRLVWLDLTLDPAHGGE